MADTLKKQVEKIIDEGNLPLYDVIIHVKDRDAPEEDAIKAGLATIRNRSMVVNAAEVLPFKKSVIADTEPRKARRQLAEDPSFSSQVALRLLSAISVGDVRSSTTEQIKRAIEETAFRSRKEPHIFWSSRSASLSLSKDDLHRIVQNGEHVAGVYTNRNLPPPRFRNAIEDASTKIIDPHATTWGVERSRAIAAWGAFGAKGKGVRVAVLDTGVDPKHPDLAGRVADFAVFDRNGRMKARQSPKDTSQHGTHVAGTIVGGNASGRHIGMAPEAQLLAGLVLDGKNGGTDAQILAGIDWAINSRADIINLSLGGLTLDPIVKTVYQTLFVRAFLAGIVVVAAIGNDGHQTTGAPGNDFFAFSIGAVDHNDRCAGFSGGRTHVVDHSRYIDQADLPLAYSKPDLSAPGVAVLSCIPGGKWARFNGTSMATPHVSGAIAQLLSATNIRKLEGQQRTSVIQDLLIGSCVELGEAGQDHRFGFGRLDIFAAIDNAKRLGY